MMDDCNIKFFGVVFGTNKFNLSLALTSLVYTLNSTILFIRIVILLLLVVLIMTPMLLDLFNMGEGEAR